MNILIKLMSIVSLVIAPHIAQKDGERGMAPVRRELEHVQMVAQPKVRFAVEEMAPAALRVVFTSLTK